MQTHADLKAKRYVSDRDLAEILGCARSTVWRHAADGLIPKPIKLGGITRFDLEAVLAVMNGGSE